MTVGCKPGHKNLEIVLEALAYLKSIGKRVPELVIAGTHERKVKKYINRPEFNAIRENIHIIKNPNNTELYNLYENAFAFVFPSLIEGWGLPLGEALSLGVVSIASDIPVLREVGGDLPVYFDPNSRIELAGIIDFLQSDREAYSVLRDRIKAKQGQFRTWTDVATEILAIASEVADTNGKSVGPN